jgi:hypothetical protein
MTFEQFFIWRRGQNYGMSEEELLEIITSPSPGDRLWERYYERVLERRLGEIRSPKTEE